MAFRRADETNHRGRTQAEALGHQPIYLVQRKLNLCWDNPDVSMVLVELFSWSAQKWTAGTLP